MLHVKSIVVSLPYNIYRQTDIFIILCIDIGKF